MRYRLVAACLLALCAPAALAQAIDIPGQFGSRIQPLSPRAAPLASGDFDGDGVADAVYAVRVLPKAGTGGIAAGVSVVDPWGAAPLADGGEPLALAIVQGQKKFLVHDADNLGTPIWSDPKLPLEVAKKGSRAFREFQRYAKGIRNDVLVLGTEAGIDIALYWNGSRFALFWPREEP